MPMQAGDVPATWADTSLLEELTGYKPNTDLITGVQKFVSWYREYYNVQIEVVVYEPELHEDDFFNSRVETDLNVFKNSVDIILANRMFDELQDIAEKVFTRDLFGAD